MDGLCAHLGLLRSNSVSSHRPDRTSCRSVQVSSAVLTLKCRWSGVRHWSNDRQDLDVLVATGDATRRLIALSARGAVDGNREDVGAHRSQHVPRVIPVASLRYWPCRGNPVSVIARCVVGQP